ncbi:MAG TPA: hypothetical protein VMF31_03825 [Solirubrobacterales bacterium]|nr:hypothetical protein [Solirubrobacterales bacterium]
MRYVKKLGMAVVAMLAVGALAAGSASAATGDGNVDVVVDGGTACNVNFHWDGTNITNLAPTAPCYYESIPIDITDSTLAASFSSGVASLTGTVVADIGFTCTYNTSSLGAITGTYSDAGGIRSFDGGPKNVAKTGGFFLCPNPLVGVELQNGTIEL